MYYSLEFLNILSCLKNIDMNANFGYNSFLGRLSDLFCKNMFYNNSIKSSCLGLKLSLLTYCYESRE